MNKETQETLDFAKEYSRDIIKITDDYKDAIAKLDKISQDYKLLKLLLNFATPIITILLIIIAVFVFTCIRVS